MSELILTRKRIDLNASPVLYDRPITLMSFVENWEIRNAHWHYEDDALIGKNDKPEPGVIFSKRSFPGNVLVDFYGQTVLPPTHDINTTRTQSGGLHDNRPAGSSQSLRVIWNFSWDDAANKVGASYIAGVQANAIIEKAPEYKILASVPSLWFTPGRMYHIQAGSIDGHCFLFVNDELRLEVFDTEPINSSEHTRVGFEVYQSTVKISRVVIHQIAWKEDPI